MLTLTSPAKINLFLKIVKKREDGFHEIATLMQAVDLCDTLQFSLSNKDYLTTNVPNIPLDHNNLIFKAANLFREKTGLAFGVRVDLKKRIPVEAGLGGGSSNAATTLWALNVLHGDLVNIETLMHWSAEIGSDIPFFLSTGTAYCTGRGEIVESMEPLSLSSPMWIVKPSIGLSAKSVYQNLDYSQLSPLTPQEAIERCYSMHHLSGSFNDLESSALHLEPSLQRCKQHLKEQTEGHVLLSGSGTSFFLLGNKKPTTPTAETFQVNFLNRESTNWYTV